MDSAIWEELVTGSYKTEQFSLSGYKRCALKEREYPGLIVKEGASTNGLIYFNVSNFDLVKLDVFEGQEYKRIEVETIYNNQAITLQTYLFVGEVEMILDDNWNFNHFLKKGTQDFRSKFPGWK